MHLHVHARHLLAACAFCVDCMRIVTRRSARSVVAESHTALVRIERDDYNRVVKEAALEAVRQRSAFLGSLPVFRGVHKQHLLNIASYLKRDQVRIASLAIV